MNRFIKSRLLTALAFAALLLGVTTACGDILISGGTVTAEGECDAAGIGTVTVGGKVGPVSESPFVYKP